MEGEKSFCPSLELKYSEDGILFILYGLESFPLPAPAPGLVHRKVAEPEIIVEVSGGLDTHVSMRIQ